MSKCPLCEVQSFISWKTFGDIKKVYWKHPPQTRLFGYVRASGHLGFQINIKHNCVKYHRGNCQIVRRNKSCGKIDKIMTKEKTNEISL